MTEFDPPADQPEALEGTDDAQGHAAAVSPGATHAVHLRGEARVLGPDGLFHLLEHLPLAL